MLKYALALRTLNQAGAIVDRAFVRPLGDGAEAEAALDLIMETVSVLDYDCDYLPGFEITQVTNDSRQVAKNSIFTAINGAREAGKKFVPQALKQGAKIIVSEENLSSLLLPGTVNLVVKDSYRAYALLCEAFYDFPTAAMSGFAITGTNGKTTSAMLIRHILQQSDQPCGMISTVEYDLGSGKKIRAERTTPQAGELFEFFHQMRSLELKKFVMEVSSHALAQHRIGSVKFQAAIFTNLTGDHLDYHHTFEEYFRVKTALFTESMAENAPVIINCDDHYGYELSQNPQVKNPVTFGQNHGQWRLKECSATAAGVAFTLDNGQLSQRFSCNLLGAYNIYNIAGAVLALHCSGRVSLQDSAVILSNTPIAIPGRLESFKLPNGATALVDYAHTHDALQNVLSSLRKLTSGRLFCVFGAGGDRDQSKRPLMGKAAAAGADVIFLTSDNPRSESPQKIIQDIQQGIPEAFTAVTVEIDRKKAIRMAIDASRSGDMILIAGKGHENYQEIAGVKHPFDDRDVVRGFIK